MKSNILLSILLFLLCFTSTIAQVGTLDPSFNGTGYALYTPGALHDNGYVIKSLPDTSMLVLGTAKMNGSSGPSYGILMKVLSNGAMDMSWGSNGIVSFQFGTDTYAYNMIFQPDGKILVSGIVYVTVSDAEFFVARFTEGGVLDASFNSTGYFITAYSTYEETCHAMALQSDGKIVLAGTTGVGSFGSLLFARVNTNGTLDYSFYASGYTMIDASIQDENIRSLSIMDNGTIVGVGYGYQGNPWWGEFAFMVKLTPSGTPMAGFGTNGVLIPPVFLDNSTANKVVVSNNAIYVTGYMNDASNNWQIFLTKLDTLGNADMSFGTNGITLTSPNPLSTGVDLMIGGDDKIYVCGTTGMGAMGPRDFIILRYAMNGQPDLSFHPNGYVITSVGPDWDEAYSIDMQADGKLIVTGMRSGLSTTGTNDLPIARYINDAFLTGCVANFSANPTAVCAASSVSFTDQSIVYNSVPNSWNWSFPGGTPSSSTLQNPVVTYNNSGTYNVQLIASDGTFTDTIIKLAYITVKTIPGQAGIPAGPTQVCNYSITVFSIPQIQGADEVNWALVPANAGSIFSIGNSIAITWSPSYTGTATLNVNGQNNCGAGLSSFLQITVSPCTGINSPESPELQLWPNPARDMLALTFPASFVRNTTEIRILSSYGQEMKRIKVTSQETSLSLPLSELPSGVYFLEIQPGAENRILKRFVVCR